MVTQLSNNHHLLCTWFLYSKNNIRLVAWQIEYQLQRVQQTIDKTTAYIKQFEISFEGIDSAGLIYINNGEEFQTKGAAWLKARLLNLRSRTIWITSCHCHITSYINFLCCHHHLVLLGTKKTVCNLQQRSPLLAIPCTQLQLNSELSS